MSKEFVCQIPASIVREGRLSSGAKNLLLVLMSYNPSYPSYPVLMTDTGMREKAVRRAIKELLSNNVISYKKGNNKVHKNNVYQVKPQDQWFTTVVSTVVPPAKGQAKRYNIKEENIYYRKDSGPFIQDNNPRMIEPPLSPTVLKETSTNTVNPENENKQCTTVETTIAPSSPYSPRVLKAIRLCLEKTSVQEVAVGIKMVHSVNGLDLNNLPEIVIQNDSRAFDILNELGLTISDDMLAAMGFLDAQDAMG